MICCALVLSCGWTGLAQAEIKEEHQQLVDEVTQRLLAVMEKPDHWEVWPPKVTVIDPGYANAMAGYRVVDGVEVPYIEVTVDTIEDVANFDAEVLAFTIGHELGHLYHDHSRKTLEFYQQYGDKLTGLRLACGREQELEADLFGMQARDRGWLRIEGEGGWRELLTSDLGATRARYNTGQQFTLNADGRDSGWFARARMLGGDGSYKIAGEVGLEEQFGNIGYSLRASIRFGF